MRKENLGSENENRLRSLKNRQITLILRNRLFTLAYFGIIIFLIATGDYICLFYRLFDIPCAGCGMTRAYTALLKLDIKSAIEYHYLFPIPAFWAIYLIFRKHLRPNKRLENIMVCISIALFIMRWIMILF